MEFILLSFLRTNTQAYTDTELWYSVTNENYYYMFEMETNYSNILNFEHDTVVK